MQKVQCHFCPRMVGVKGIKLHEAAHKRRGEKPTVQNGESNVNVITLLADAAIGALEGPVVAPQKALGFVKALRKFA